MTAAHPYQAHSPIHEHDARLCHFIDAAQTLKLLGTNGNSPPHRKSASLLRSSFYATEGNLASEHVWMIVCRWKAVKSLYLAGFTCERSVCCDVRNMGGVGKDFKGRSYCGLCCSDGLRDYGRVLSGKPSNFADFYKQCVEMWLAMEVEELVVML